jgi:hypothetical protein
VKQEFRPHPRTSRRLWLGVAGVLSLLVAGSQGGCVTASEVKSIVADSNAALLPGPSFGMPGGSRTADWKSAVRKIEEFIASHPEQAALIHSLRMREGLVLAMNQEDNLAKQVFALVDPAQLHSERDKALYGVWQPLTWWYKRGSLDSVENATPLNPTERETGRLAVIAIETQCKTLPATSEVRLYLEAFNALLNIRILNDTTALGEGLAKVADALEQTLARFALVLTSDDLQWIQNHPLGGEDAADAPLMLLKRRLYGRLIIRELKAVAKEKGLSPKWKYDWIALTNF